MSEATRSGGRWGRWRRSSQLTVALFFLALPVAALHGFHRIGGTLAALDLGGLDLVEPAGAVSAALASRQIGATLLLGMLPPLLLALATGPVFCSWICPWGFLSELLDRIRFRGRHRRWEADAFLRLRSARALLLGALLLASMLLAVPLAAVLSAPRLVTTLPLEAIFLGGVSAVTAVLLGVLLFLELLGPRRFWCRALCPVGAAAKLQWTPRTLTVRWHEPTCSCPGVPACQTHCAWGIDPRRMAAFDGCTNCLACVDACPTGSLAPGFGRVGYCREKEPARNGRPGELQRRAS